MGRGEPQHQLGTEVRRNVEPDSFVYTDALRSYSDLGQTYMHRVVDHAEAYVDGAVHTNTFDNLNLPIPFPDALQEFSLNTGSQNSSSGFQGGAQVAAVTKSGTNQFHGDAYDYDDLSRVTWARIPHFYSTPYYVYQYATCFASSAQVMQQLTGGDDAERRQAVDRYLTLLKSGGSDHPMALLRTAGVDLSKPETVRAVVDQLDTLVTRLEKTIS